MTAIPTLMFLGPVDLTNKPTDIGEVFKKTNKMPDFSSGSLGKLTGNIVGGNDIKLTFKNTSSQAKVPTLNYQGHWNQAETKFRNWNTQLNNKGYAFAQPFNEEDKVLTA